VFKEPAETTGRGADGATAMTKAAGLQHIPQGGELNVFRLFE
jgi:lanthanide-dependent methanol dehydrogenase